MKTEKLREASFVSGCGVWVAGEAEGAHPPAGGVRGDGARGEAAPHGCAEGAQGREVLFPRAQGMHAAFRLLCRRQSCEAGLEMPKEPGHALLRPPLGLGARCLGAGGRGHCLVSLGGFRGKKVLGGLGWKRCRGRTAAGRGGSVRESSGRGWETHPALRSACSTCVLAAGSF